MGPGPPFQDTIHDDINSGTIPPITLQIRLGFEEYSNAQGWIYRPLTSCHNVTCDFCATGRGFQFTNPSAFVDSWLQKHRSNLEVISTIFNLFTGFDEEEHDLMERIMQCVCQFLRNDAGRSCALEAALLLAILAGALSQVPLISRDDHECCYVTHQVHKEIFQRIRRLEVTVFDEVESILQKDMWEEHWISGACFLLLLVVYINTAYDSLDVHHKEAHGAHMAMAARKIFDAFHSVLSGEGI
ncbi:hypothetical protein ACJ73_07239 [Blastomyces percursus]|uniref:Uncharacterized protein n=1 Tax=Blastomyces percursus TaxID=1658174 RepID=A0A1J9R054_9EURO|nr:hypothetical protein ACJ73_07239 [Blastomyces percursus]